MDKKLSDLYLSTACGCLASLASMEPNKTTRRYRKLTEIERKIYELMKDEYQAGFNTREELELACNIIKTTEQMLNKDLNNTINDGTDF